MAARSNRRRNARTGTSRREGPSQGWIVVVAGIAVVAAGVFAFDYVRDKLGGAAGPPAAQSAPARKPVPPPKKPSTAPPEKDYGFYDMLPNSEVPVPDDSGAARPDKKPAPVEMPGTYVLHAGAFSTYADADRMKARLALLGIKSSIQAVEVDGRTLQRVRIGPIEDLAELNRVRTRLRAAEIEVIVNRAGE